MILGNLLIGFGISLGVLADLGIDPGMTFFYGMAKLTGLSLGGATALFNILFLIPIILIDRKKIGIATIFNMLLMGYIVNFFSATFFAGIVQNNLMINLLILITGIVIQTFGVALYTSANMGQAPLDGLPNIICMFSNKFTYRSVRVVQDSLLVLIGVLCGIQVGIGTLILMFMVGPLIHFFVKKLNPK